MRLRLGHFDPPGPLQQIPKTARRPTILMRLILLRVLDSADCIADRGSFQAICTDETIALARDGTIQGARYETRLDVSF